MEKILDIAAALILSLGGGSAIIFFVSKYIGEMWAIKLFEKERLKNSKQLEEYKNKLEIEINRLSAISEKELYITKAQYDNEYKIYTEIWRLMHECVLNAKQLFPKGFESVPIDEKELEAFMLNKYNEFAEVFNKFTSCIEEHAPFYKEEFYERFVEMRGYIAKIGNAYKFYVIDQKHNVSFKYSKNVEMPPKLFEEVYDTMPRKIIELEKDLIKLIRMYLMSLQLK